MNIQADRKELNEDLIILKRYLHDGWLLKRKFLRKHDIDGQRIAFDIDELEKEYQKEINKWLNTVATFISNRFENEKQLHFHFVEPKRDVYTGNHPLGKFTHPFEKHLYALEEVINQLDNLSLNRFKNGHEYDFPLELALEGKVFKIQGYGISNSIELVTLQKAGTSVILEPIFKICRSKPTTWKTISKKQIESVAGLDNLFSVQKIFKNFYQLSKYISGIGLTGILRKLFVGKIDNQKIKMRISVPSKDWDNLSNKDKKEVVNILSKIASSRK